MVKTALLLMTLRVFGSAGAESQLTPANESSALNPGNIGRVPLQTNVADVSTFFEATPESKRWKARVKLRGSSSDRGSDSIALGEAFVQMKAASWLDVTAGRVIEKWGTGYGWTPTAFVGPRRNPTDPNDRRSEYRGADMIRADAFVDDTTISVYAFGGGSFAARAYRLIGGTDVALHVRDSRVGLSLSRVFGEALELHGEIARDAGAARAVAGGQYTFVNDTNIVLEIYHATDGLTHSEWSSFLDSIDHDLQDANAHYAPLRMARTYTFGRLSRDFGKTNGEVIAIANLRDGSAIVRAAVSHKLRPSLSVYVIDTEFTGSNGSELSLMQVSRVVTAGVRVYF
ncbi:MAG TPA: hypothetical protein VEK79_03100 [Thermoanaerobaculia bacterium]|nr:hypothetical protein [Thermoanaerobaculia bacterium]